MNESDAGSSYAAASSAEILAAIVESAPVAIVLTNCSGDISLVNRGAEILFGYRRDELLGQKVELLVPQPLRSAHPKLRGDFLKEPIVRQMGSGRELFG